jgi:catechol 2,3-dioxygenase-like lactoylglutathione lyase family enzyme
LILKRFHVHIAVDDLAANIRFYSAVFGSAPSVEKADYAKWMLDDPRINFAISQRGLKAGLDHLGLQVESDDELTHMRGQIERAQIAALDQHSANCCYAKSNKHWIADPQGIAWETFHTLESVPVYGEVDRPTSNPSQAKSACCAPPATIATHPAKTSTCC